MPPGRRALGDFQTPEALALAVCRQIADLVPAPRRIVEPTCGAGAFLRAAAVTWPGVALEGWELVEDRRREAGDGPWTVHAGDAFTLDWSAALAPADGLLLLGNPPWGSADRMARVRGLSPPRRAGRTVGDARTGAGNFDAAEWLLLAWLEALAGADATVAMLLKSSTVRRVLLAAHRAGLPASPVGVWHVDARRAWGVRVDACLLAVGTRGPCGPHPVAPGLGKAADRAVLVEDGRFIADADAWCAGRHLLGTAPRQWRSGVKHDCAPVMVLDPEGANGLGERPDLEPERTRPWLRGADLAAGRPATHRLVLPHHDPQEPTAPLADTAPRTWAYLTAHADRLDARRSRIWRAAPRFGLYGLGAYSFAPWKVAAPAIHRPTVFRVVGPVDGQPVLLDDTCVFVPCDDRAEAEAIAAALASPQATAFLRARALPRAKRAVTVRTLAELDWRRVR